MKSKYSKANPLAKTLTKDEFVRLYVSQKKMIIEIAGLYEVSQDAVFRLRRSYGIGPRRNQKRHLIPITRRRPLDCSSSPEEIRSLYWDDQLSMDDIGRRFGVTRKAVSYYFKKHALPCDRRRESATFRRFKRSFEIYSLSFIR